MKNKKTILIVISLILFFILFLGKFILDKKESEDFSKKIIIAIEKVKEKYPDLNIDSKDAYIRVNKFEDKWYTYLFTEKDKGLGIEVYYEKGDYTITFDYNLYQYRVKLIEKMNELMPESKELNKYLSWNPKGIKYKTISKGNNNNIIGYVVVKDSIDVEKQLAIDYEIMKYAYNLSKEMELPSLDGLVIGYYEGNINDIKLTKNNNLFLKIDRDFSVSSFEVYMTQRSICKTKEYCKITGSSYGKIKKINEYNMLFSTINTKVETISLENVLNSKENFINYANSIMK